MCANWRIASSARSPWATAEPSISTICRLSITSAVPGRQGSDSPSSGLTTTDLEDIERATIERVFEQVKGERRSPGKMLGISRATLYRKLKRYNIGGREVAAPMQALQ